MQCFTPKKLQARSFETLNALDSLIVGATPAHSSLIVATGASLGCHRYSVCVSQCCIRCRTERNTTQLRRREREREREREGERERERGDSGGSSIEALEELPHQLLGKKLLLGCFLYFIHGLGHIASMPRHNKTMLPPSILTMLPT